MCKHDNKSRHAIYYTSHCLLKIKQFQLFITRSNKVFVTRIGNETNSESHTCYAIQHGCRFDQFTTHKQGYIKKIHIPSSMKLTSKFHP